MLERFHNCSIADAVLSAFNPFKTGEQHSMGRCCKGVDRLSLFERLRSSATSLRLHGAMLMQALHCPHCHGTHIVRHGQTRQDKQQYRCRKPCCMGRTFLLDYNGGYGTIAH